MNIRTLVLFLSLVATGRDFFAADEIHWTITGQNSVTFDWRGTTAEKAIRYGTSSGVYTQEVNADTPNPLPTSSSGPFWEARLTGLQENTLYYYAIGNGLEHTFHTPPPRGDSDFIVYAEGDVGSSLKSSQMIPVQNLIAAGLPAFVLVAGDITYGEDDKTRVDQHFNDVMVWSQKAAYMPAWGNHDWDILTSPQAQINEYEGRFDLPNSQISLGAETAVGNGPGEDWYWFDYGNVRFIAYPEPYVAAWQDWSTKAQALMDAAQADPDLDFIVTFGHRPAYSSGHHAGSSTLNEILDAFGDKHRKYVLNINGHSHNYERSHPQHGVVHITAGTGGASLESAGSCFWKMCDEPAWSAFRAMHHGVLRFHFTATGIEGSFICGPPEADKNDIVCNPGEVVDSFVIGAPNADTSPPGVSITAPVPGATVSGNIPMPATASDNIDLAGWKCGKPAGYIS